MQTDHLISARRPELVIVNKKRKEKKRKKRKKTTSRIVNFIFPADHRLEETCSERPSAKTDVKKISRSKKKK